VMEPYSRLFKEFTDLAQKDRTDSVMSAIFPMCLLLRLFKAFSSQPRLALITNTLAVAATDLAHFLIVFLCVFVSYAVMGTVCFGQEDQNFSTLDRSTMSCFRCLMGDFDFDLMVESGRTWPSILYFASFMGLLSMIVLNMLIAIIMDAYAEAKNSSKSAETLPGQVKELINRSMSVVKGRGLSIQTILSRCSRSIEEAQDEMLSVETFMEKVPGLSQEQAEQELQSCVTDWLLQHPAEVHLGDVVSLCSSIQVELLSIRASSASMEKHVQAIEKNQDAANELHINQIDRLQPIEVVGGRKYHLC